MGGQRARAASLRSLREATEIDLSPRRLAELLSFGILARP